MEKKLKDLRQQMIDARLNKIDFSEQGKQQVLENIQGRSGKKRSSHSSLWWKSGLSVAVCLGLLFGGIAIAMNHPSSSSEAINPPDLKSNVGPSSSNSGPDGTSSHVSAGKPTSQHYPPIKDPGPLTKEQVANRMLNTADYFKTAQGSYTYIQNHHKRVVQYEILMKEGDQFRSYCKITIPGKGVKSINIANGTNLITISPQDKSYMKSTSSPYHKGNPVTIDSVFGQTANGASVFAPRNRPFVGIAFNSLFAYEEAGSFLRDFNRWDIVKQDVTVAGHKAVLVKGTSDRHDIKTFEFWINRATGILMNMKFYDSQGNVTNSMETTKLQLNKPVDMSKFTIHVPKGYTDLAKKMAKQMKPDPRAKKILHLAGAKMKQGNVQEVYKKIKTHVPFLYEFQDPHLYLYSDVLNKYENYYETELYMVPDYKRKMKSKQNNSEMLSVREYNKNSFVRQKGVDFQSSKEFKKHHLKSFTMNGIDWKGYTDKSQTDFPLTYFTGTKGNYVYEVVGQDLPFAKVKEYLKSFKKD